jgi:hypothetical protein
MPAFTAIFSLLIGAAGWYYMFYSRAAANLNGIEDQSLNRRRHRLRQVGGFNMLLLAIGLFAGFNAVDPEVSKEAFVSIWMGIFLLLLIVVLLAMVDLRLTWRLRQRRRP